MTRRLPQFFILSAVMAGFAAMASAGAIEVGAGILSYDVVAPSDDQFDITNLTGLDALPTDFPITTPLTFTITSLTVNFTSGPALVLPGADFAEVDAEDDIDCIAGACNLFGDSITSAVLLGTFSPTTGIAGLPSGTSILPAFSDPNGDTGSMITPSVGDTLVAGTDLSIISATVGTASSTVPEPSAFALAGIGFLLLGLVGLGRWLRGVNSGRIAA
jgi:hypothetical protein